MSKLDFENIYHTYQEQMYRLCLGYFGGDSQLAKDTCQEVFIKVWQNLDCFRGHSKISTWIYRIAVNTCLNVLRTYKGRTQIPLKEDVLSSDESPPTDDQLQVMYRCIYQLKPKERSIILLVLDQEAYEDIAAVMGISENNLRVKIHIIKDKLSKCVAS